MDKVNLLFFYELGKQLTSLTKIEGITPNKRMDVIRASVQVKENIMVLFKLLPGQAVCRASGDQLISALDKVHEWFYKVPYEEITMPDFQLDRGFQAVIDSAKKFEIVLSEELPMLATYYVTQKGIYSTSDLISHAENILLPSVLGKIDEKVKNEIRESGRCLAFDTFTASGFHIMRATEGVIHQYYLEVCKPEPKPDRLESWGAYFSELKKKNLSHVQEVLGLLQQIKDQHRNLIMHPEVVLSYDDAYALFEIAKSAIITMASKLP